MNKKLNCEYFILWAIDLFCLWIVNREHWGQVFFKKKVLVIHWDIELKYELIPVDFKNMFKLLYTDKWGKMNVISEITAYSNQWFKLLWLRGLQLVINCVFYLVHFWSRRKLGDFWDARVFHLQGELGISPAKLNIQVLKFFSIYFSRLSITWLSFLIHSGLSRPSASLVSISITWLLVTMTTKRRWLVRANARGMSML